MFDSLLPPCGVELWCPRYEDDTGDSPFVRGGGGGTPCGTPRPWCLEECGGGGACVYEDLRLLCMGGGGGGGVLLRCLIRLFDDLRSLLWLGDVLLLG